MYSIGTLPSLDKYTLVSLKAKIHVSDLPIPTLVP